MSSTIASPHTPSANAGLLTFQSTPNFEVNTNRSFNEGPTAPSLGQSKEEVFAKEVHTALHKNIAGSYHDQGCVLKEVLECILQKDEQPCDNVNPYMHSFWRNLHVRSGCVCIEEQVAIPDSIHDADLQNLHLTHPWSWRMTSLGQYDFWSYMEREIFNKSQYIKSKIILTLMQQMRQQISLRWV